MPSLSDRPHFVIAGATRSGTTTLYKALSQNRGIFMPEEKELHFFYRDTDYRQGRAFYEAYFDNARDGQVCGEASPSYFVHGHTLDDAQEPYWNPQEDSAKRMNEMFPDMKVVLSLRNPVTRAYSLFQRYIWRGQEHLDSFEDVIDAELSGKRTPERTAICPIYLNRYALHLKYWLNFFPLSNVHIMIMEEWTKNPAEALRDLESFLGVEPSGLSENDIQPSNEGRAVHHPVLKFLTRLLPNSGVGRALSKRLLSKKGYDSLKPELFRKLQSVFEDDVAYVEEVLGRSIPAWREYA